MKKILAIAGATYLLLCMCQVAAARTTTLKVLTALNPADFKPQADAFEKAHPDIKINPIYGTAQNIDDKFLTMCVGGQAPDILSNMQVLAWPRYVRQGLLADLTPFMNRDKKKLDLEDFPSRLVKDYTIKGKMYFLPFEQSLPYCITYNATLLSQAGLPKPTSDWSSNDWDWDEMVTYAKKLTKVGADGKATQFGIDTWITNELGLVLSWAADEDWVDEESYKTGVVNKITLNTPENLKAYKRFSELYTVHKVYPGSISYAGFSDKNTGFNTNRIGMWFYAGTLMNPAASKANYKWGLAPFPSMKPGNRSGFSYANGFGIAKGSKNQEAAWTFVEWMTHRGFVKGFSWPTRAIRRQDWSNALEWWPLDTSVNSKQELTQFITSAHKISRVTPREIVFPFNALINSMTTQVYPAFTGKADMAVALDKGQKAMEAEVKKMVRK